MDPMTRTRIKSSNVTVPATLSTDSVVEISSAPTPGWCKRNFGVDLMSFD